MSRVLLLIGLVVLTACTASQNAMYESLKLSFTNPNTVIEAVPLNPNYRYLRADVNNNPALLVLGYLDPDPLGLIEVWYSASNETIKIQNGRLLGSHGLDKNWIEVKFINAPPLADAFDHQKAAEAQLALSRKYKALPNPLSFTRIRTVMPGYRAQIEETVFMRALLEAPDDAPKYLRQGPYANNLRWLEERIVPKARVLDNPGLAPVSATYAVDFSSAQPRPVYGKQCLFPGYCLSWSAWPWPPVGAGKS